MNITTFNAFKSKNFRLFFVGQSISLLGTWMQKTAVSWLIYSITNSKIMLGIAVFSSLFPAFVLSFLGGVTADRYNRYKLLLLTQIASMLQAILLTAIVFFKFDNVWLIISLGALLGCINAFDVPARQSLMIEMIDNEKDLPNALALNSSMVNLSRFIGPMIAGWIIELWGNTVCIGLNALSFTAVIATLLLMKISPFIPEKNNAHVIEQMKEGWRYLKNNKDILFVIKMIGLMSLFVLPYNTLMPVFAKDIYHGTASTFGTLNSSIGLGAFAAAIFMASLKHGTNLNRVLAINALVFGVGLVLFSYCPNLHLAKLCVAIAAFGMMIQITLTNTIVQTKVSHNMRGRVISIFVMVLFGLQPLGSLLVGFSSQYFDARVTLIAEGILALAIGYLHFRNLKRNESKDDVEIQFPNQTSMM